MNTLEKKVAKKSAPTKSAGMVQAICGCKWSLTVYQLLRTGVNRPGEMVRNVEGLTTKVLNECLRRNMDFGILEKHAFAEIPPRVEYHVTEFGQQFLNIIDELENLQNAIDAQPHFRQSS